MTCVARQGGRCLRPINRSVCLNVLCCQLLLCATEQATNRRRHLVACCCPSFLGTSWMSSPTCCASGRKMSLAVLAYDIEVPAELAICREQHTCPKQDACRGSTRHFDQLTMLPRLIVTKPEIPGTLKASVWLGEQRSAGLLGRLLNCRRVQANKHCGAPLATSTPSTVSDTACMHVMCA